MNERTPSYFAVIPADVRYDEHIPANAKLLYGEISALINAEGFCHASNQYFANVYGMAEDTITRLISKLESAGYIVRELERDNTGQVVRRKLYLKVSVPDEQPPGNISSTSRITNREGTGQKVGMTNTSITDIDKENKKESPPKKSAKADCAQETDIDPLQLCIEWIRNTFPSEDAERKNQLYFAMQRFVENRAAIKKPIRSKGAVTALCNRLLRYSKDHPDRLSAMVDLLDLSTTNNWQSIYPPKNTQAATPARIGRVYECL